MTQTRLHALAAAVALTVAACAAPSGDATVSTSEASVRATAATASCSASDRRAPDARAIVALFSLLAIFGAFRRRRNEDLWSDDGSGEVEEAQDD